MGNCGGTCAAKTEGPKNYIDKMISDIQNTFLKEGPAVNWVSDHETYLYMMAHAPFYVSAIHCKDGKETWWAAAVDREAYDKWEEVIEHQHHPYEEHEHYLCINAGLGD